MRSLLLLLLLGLALLGLRAYARGAPEVEGLEHGTLTHDGLKRDFYYYVPENHGGKLPMVLAFHGGGGNAASFAETTGFRDLARQEGFIVVYPQGTGRGKGGTWNAGMRPPQGYAERKGIDDVGFVVKLIDEMQRRFPVDPQAVFATGMSKGGMLTYRLGCELSDRIAAIAPVAATMTVTDCRPTQPVALLHIHGASDQHVPFKGGKGRYTARGVDGYPPVARGIDAYRKADGAAAEPKIERLSGDTECFRYPGGKVPVGYCLVQGGGHAWPGSAPKRWQERRDVTVTQSFSASRLIWEFFEKVMAVRAGRTMDKAQSGS